MGRVKSFLSSTVGVGTSVATIVGGLFGVYLFWVAPAAVLVARQQTNEFQVPSVALKPDNRDTLAAKQDTLLGRFYDLAISLTPLQRRQQLRDSNVFKRPSYLFDHPSRPKQLLDKLHVLTTLNLENTGDKTLKGLVLVYATTGYYEYTDSHEQLHHGRFTGKLELDPLAGGEKVKLYLWTGYSTPEAPFRITHDDGAVTAEPVLEASGWVRWLASHKIFLDVFFSMFVLPLALAAGAMWLWHQAKLKANAEQQAEAADEAEGS